MYLFNCLSFHLPTFRLQSIFILCLTVVCFSFSWSMWLLLFIYFVLLYWTFKPSAMRTTYRQTGGWADGRTNSCHLKLHSYKMPLATVCVQQKAQNTHMHGIRTVYDFIENWIFNWFAITEINSEKVRIIPFYTYQYVRLSVCSYI